jgi:hypothetical protein
MELATIAQETNYENYLLKGITYEAYFAQMQGIVANITKGLTPNVAHPQYFPINLKRMQRLEKTIHLSYDLMRAIENLDGKIYWLVLSEYWCGDAAQSLPLINKIAEASQGKIVLRILYRDQNTELMTKHLTNGGSAIPKLIQLDSDYSITGEWGPRPQVAQNLVRELKSNPETASSYAEQLHRWYAQDKTFNIQKELTELIHKVSALV